MSVENWLPIPGYPDYEITNTGKVRSFKGLGRPRELKQSYVGSGHLKVSLIDSGGVTRTKFIHQLLMLTFVGPRPEGMEVCHNDDNPLNNRLDNLRYDTHRANMQDAVRNGRGVGRRKKQLPTPIEAKEQA